MDRADRTGGRHPMPGVARAGVNPDVTAPDGSQIRLLTDARTGAERASMCEVTLAGC